MPVNTPNKEWTPEAIGNFWEGLVYRMGDELTSSDQGDHADRLAEAFRVSAPAIGQLFSSALAADISPYCFAGIFSTLHQMCPQDPTSPAIHIRMPTLQ